MRGSTYHYKRVSIGPPANFSLAGRRLPNIEYWLGNFVIFQRFGTSIANKPFIFVIFQGARTPCPSHLDPRMLTTNVFGIIHRSKKFFMVYSYHGWYSKCTRQSYPLQKSCMESKTCTDPEWEGTGGPDHPENHKNTEFLTCSNTGPDPLKNHKTAWQNSMLGRHRHDSETPF